MENQIPPIQPESYQILQPQLTEKKKTSGYFKMLLLILALLLIAVIAYSTYSFFRSQTNNISTAINLPVEYLVQTTPTINLQNSAKVTSFAGNIQNLTKNKYEQKSPVVYNDTIAWLDFSDNSIKECQLGNIPHQPCISQIMVYKIATNSTQKITSNSTWKDDIQLTDNYIAWTERKNQVEFSDQERMLMNLDTGKVTTLAKGNLVAGNQAVLNETDRKISLLNLQSQEVIPLLERTGSREYDSISNVAISDGYLIWEEGYWKQGGESGVILYGSKLSDTSSKKEIATFKSSFNYQHSQPSIYKNLVVWEEYEKENPESRNLGSQYYATYLYNIDNGEKSLLFSKMGGDSSPQIFGKYIVYADMFSQGYKVYNLDDQTEYTIPIKTIGPQGANLWSLHSNRFVWVDSESLFNSAGDILLLELP